ncbi:hypothetical protein [Mangrovimonas xylaniphaga]|uniref:hypothetical protein n=1 Tax=Mangrovimonas xylaniphaga TaxID=1645915 RepID=UPI000A849477|nr:hypothetical protein [Mangrovimonas xylaniphaga]
MIEIIAIISLSKSIKTMVLEKGLKPTKYIVTMIVLWILFEFLFAIIGAIIFGEGLMIYLFCMLGAALGGYTGYSIAKNAKPNGSHTVEENLQN